MPSITPLFAPLLPVLKDFANTHSLSLSHSFDLDPLGTHACYFCSWTTEKRLGRFIRICVADPLGNDAKFYIDASKNRFHKRWDYAAADGLERLSVILAEARQALISE